MASLDKRQGRYGRWQMSNNDYNAILDERKEDRRQKRAEASNFLNYSNCTFNWMQSVIQTGVQSLQEDGVTKKDLKTFLNETLEETWQDDYQKEFSEETLSAIRQAKKASKQLKNQDAKPEQELGNRISDEIDNFVEQYDIQDELLS